MKKIIVILGLVAAFTLIACGVTPGLTNATTPLDKSLPSYHYQDTEGNFYDITQQKLIYTPVSATNTIDGITDEGLYTELNISRNDYSKIAAVCEKQLQRNQGQLTDRDTNLPLPFLEREGGNYPKRMNMDYTAVNALNFILEPFLEDE